jgi:hypothetical protein
MKSFIFTINVILLSLSINIKAQVNGTLDQSTVDSTLLTNLRQNIDLYLSDIDDITNTYIDSSRYSIIRGRKLYHRISLSKAIRPDSLVNLFRHIDREQKYKVYAYIFDYLFQNGLDFEYDYYTHFLYDSTNNYYLDRSRTTEYINKKKVLYYFFNIYKNYKLFIGYYPGTLIEDPLTYITNAINYGNLKFPISCENVLLMKNVLDRDTFDGKFNIDSSK